MKSSLLYIHCALESSVTYGMLCDKVVLSYKSTVLTYYFQDFNATKVETCFIATKVETCHLGSLMESPVKMISGRILMLLC